MITLYAFGPAFGLPDPSPFVTKAEMLLKLSKLPYRKDTGSFSRAPKGKLPYIEEDGRVIADSTFIRLYLEEKHGIDFDAGLDAAQRGTAWAFDKMFEDHVYWLVVRERWLIDRNFYAGPARFFERAPAPARPLAIRYVRWRLTKTLKGQGTGRHSESEIETLAARAIDAAASCLGDKRYFMGDRPCGADATVSAFITNALCPLFESAARRAAERHENLLAYSRRMTEEFFPDLARKSAA
jgi:glutathione S-transferase